MIGLREGAHGFAAMNLLQLPRHTVFICDTYINPDPTAEQLADMAVLAAEEVRRFGLTPRVALRVALQLRRAPTTPRRARCATRSR